MRGSGAAIGLVAFPIAGLILLILRIFRVKHTFDLEEMAGIVVIGIPVLMVWAGILYCVGIALCSRNVQMSVLSNLEMSVSPVVLRAAGGDVGDGAEHERCGAEAARGAAGC